jgi:D-alanine-D-alanine ligase
MPSTRVLVLYNEPVLSPDHPDAESEHDILYTVDVVSRSLIELGYPVSRLGVPPRPEALLAGLRDHPADVVFNLFEGTATDGDCETCVASILEWLRIPFTGSPSQALSLARSKPLTKHLLRGAGLPTADAFTIEGDAPCPENHLGWPVIVKPAREDASVGIEQESVVTSQEQLEARVRHVQKTYGPLVLVERFIAGREFNVPVIELPELRLLPVSEILFTDDTPGYWPLVTFDAKWRPNTHDFQVTPPVNPAPLDPALAAEVDRLAKRAYRVIGCRDYARVDMRVDENGRPFILEVNPNPCISPLAGLAAGLASAQIPHPEFLRSLVESARQRGTANSDDETEDIGSALSPIRRSANRWEVRPARASDRSALRQVAASCESYTAEPYKWRVDELLSAPVVGQRRRGEHLVLRRRGQVGGWACFRERPGAVGVYSLDALAVAADVQGRGLGRLLLEAVVEEVLQRGGRLLVADVASHSAFISARRLLLSQGFRLSGDLPDYYRPDQGRLSYVRYLLSSEEVEANASYTPTPSDRPEAGTPNSPD